MRSLIMLGSGEPTLKVYDLRQGLPAAAAAAADADGSLAQPLVNANPNSQATHLAVSPDAGMMAFTYGGTTTNHYGVWRNLFPFSEIEVPSIAFSGYALNVAASNEHFAVCGRAPYVYCWRRDNLYPVILETTGMNDDATGLAFSPDGARLACSHGTSPRLRVFNLADGTYAVPASTDAAGGNWSQCTFTGDGQYIFVAGNTSPHASLYDAQTLARVWSSTSTRFKSGNNGRVKPHPFKPQCVLVSAVVNPDTYLIYEFNCETREQTPVVTLAQLAEQNIGANDWRVPSFAFSRATKELYVMAGSRNANLGIANHNDVAQLRVYDAMDYAFKRLEYIQTEGAALRNFIADHWQVMVIVEKNIHQITGTVRDINNSPCARTVRAFRRSDGVCMAQTESDATTGDYRLILPDAGPYDVQFQALDGENLNDLFFARSEPEPIEV